MKKQNVSKSGDTHAGYRLQQKANSKLKYYKCIDCKSVNAFLEIGRESNIVVGYCDNCGHPIWND